MTPTDSPALRDALIAAYKQGAHDFAGEGYVPPDLDELETEACAYADAALRAAQQPNDGGEGL